MEEAIKELDYLVVWQKVKGIAGAPSSEDEIPEPRRGIDEQFDEASDKVKIKQKLMQIYLDGLKD